MRTICVALLIVFGALTAGCKAEEKTIQSSQQNDCYHSAGDKIIDRVISSSDGTETVFRIPMTYFDESFNAAVEREFITFYTNYNGVDASCALGLPQSKDIKRTISVRITPTVPVGFDRTHSRIKKEYSHLYKTDELSSIYRNPKEIDDDQKGGFKELVVLKDDSVIRNPFYILCVWPSFGDFVGSRSVCKVTREYTPHVVVEYGFYHEELKNIGVIDNNIQILLDSFGVGLKE